MKEKLKAMFKCEGGFIMSKRQMKTVEDDIWWQFAKNAGTGDQVAATKKTFEEHGYDVVEWDDNQIASDGSALFTDGKKRHYE